MQPKGDAAPCLWGVEGTSHARRTHGLSGGPEGSKWGGDERVQLDCGAIMPVPKTCEMVCVCACLRALAAKEGVVEGGDAGGEARRSRTATVAGARNRETWRRADAEAKDSTHHRGKWTSDG